MENLFCNPFWALWIPGDVIWPLKFTFCVSEFHEWDLQRYAPPVCQHLHRRYPNLVTQSSWTSTAHHSSTPTPPPTLPVLKVVKMWVPPNHYSVPVLHHHTRRSANGSEDAVQNWPQIPSVKELQRFLGFTNIYRRFIARFSQLSAPLSSLLWHKPKFLSWTPEATNAFQQLKSAFCTAPTFSHWIRTSVSLFTLPWESVQYCHKPQYSIHVHTSLGNCPRWSKITTSGTASYWLSSST